MNAKKPIDPIVLPMPSIWLLDNPIGKPYVKGVIQIAKIINDDQSSC